MSFSIINDDIVNAPKYQINIIVQQTNCCTIKGLGLSEHIAQKLGVNSYIQRRPDASGKYPKNCACLEDRSVPGTIQLMMGHTEPYVVNMYAQYAPGKANVFSKYPSYINELGNPNYDSKDFREHWFRECCRQLHSWLKSQNITQVGVPFKIGCRLGGGDWNVYSQILKEELPETVIFKL